MPVSPTVEGLSTYILEWLNVGRVDCALVYNAQASPAVDLQTLLDEQLFLVAPLAAKQGRKVRKSIPCLFMRGGTSRGPFFLESDLPADPARRDAVLLA